LKRVFQICQVAVSVAITAAAVYTIVERSMAIHDFNSVLSAFVVTLVQSILIIALLATLAYRLFSHRAKEKQ